MWVKVSRIAELENDVGAYTSQLGKVLRSEKHTRVELFPELSNVCRTTRDSEYAFLLRSPYRDYRNISVRSRTSLFDSR